MRMKKLIACFLLLSLFLTGCGEFFDDSLVMDAPTSKPVATDPTEAATEIPTKPVSTPPTEASTEPITAPQTEAPTEHIHDYLPATCINSKICATCGKTSGDPAGHSWKEATCTDPKKCSVCKETEGDPVGHDWKEATCTAPKTCSKCKETSGFAAAHDYIDGTCTSCGKSDPDDFYSGSVMVWIPTRGGKKYHTSSDCSNMIDPEYVTLEEAEDLGFTPCKRCH